jgi:hypothetical protein
LDGFVGYGNVTQMRLLLVLFATLVLVAGCGGSDGTADQPDGASSSVAGHTPSVDEPSSTQGSVKLEVDQDASGEPGEVILRVVANVPDPGIRAYEIVLNYDENVVEVVEINDVVFTDRALTPICVNLPSSDVQEDGDLQADIACGLPQKGEFGPAGEVTLARLKARAKMAGDTTFQFTRAFAATPDLGTTYALEAADPLVVTLTLS